MLNQPIEELRKELAAHNGMRGLEILSPDKVDAAVRLFYRDGFVVVRDVLSPDQVRFLRKGCEREAESLHGFLLQFVECLSSSRSVALRPSRGGR